MNRPTRFATGVVARGRSWLRPATCAGSTNSQVPDRQRVVDIVKLNAETARIVARQQEPRTAIDETVADLESRAP